jgi:hypothetical protein
MCLNWRVIAGLTLVGLSVWAIAPNLLIGALPILLIAVCPLSMMFMMRGIHGHKTSVPEESEKVSRVPPSRDVRLAELAAQRGEIERELARLGSTAEHPVDAHEGRVADQTRAAQADGLRRAAPELPDMQG